MQAMFARLGRIVARGWLVWLIAWILLFALLRAFAPDLASVTRAGQFDFLPPDVASRRGEELFQRTFPGSGTGSSVVLVLFRDKEKLRPADQQFVQDVLAPRLESLQQPVPTNTLANKQTTLTSSPVQERPIVARVRTSAERGMGPLLDSNDGKATLVVADLQTDFLSYRAVPFVKQIDGVVDRLRQQHLIPAGLQIAETGSAVVGRDMTVAKEQSAHQTSFWTIALIVALLLFVYRAPLLTLVPLLTLYIAFNVFLGLLTLTARATGTGLFEGIDVYTMVLAYGVGVDYTLFLISRYREELSDGADRARATLITLSKVGSAVAASAATGIFGIGMMAFASFGKLHQAGLSIALSLFIMLCAALTLTPALLRVGARWVFWPWMPPRQESAPPSSANEPAHTAAPAGRQTIGVFDALWHHAGEAIVRRPATMWLIAVLILAPFAVGAVVCYNRVDYGLITDLPANAPSVIGTDVIRAHFPAGDTGPVNVLIQNPHVDFSDSDVIDLVGTLTKGLMSHKAQLQIADVRSVADPLGMTPKAEQILSSAAGQGITARAELRERTLEHYVGHGANGTHVTRLDVILSVDPFARQSIQVLDRLQDAIRQGLSGALASNSDIYPTGPTASVRDLKVVADHDRILINGLVVGVVLAVLVFLRLGIGMSLYLVGTVVFSYLASLGVTFAVFWGLDPTRFPGLAWTVPLFLFVVLVAVGIDYNIFLISRVREESERSGQIRGVGEALGRTGTIISSCGIIMAGTFCSLLLGGRLAEMMQLGFALAFGILLDTFVVRPLLVPSFLILVRSGRLRTLFRHAAPAPERGVPAR
jgi:putative drug exporter of the RND superfamily